MRGAISYFLGSVVQWGDLWKWFSADLECLSKVDNCTGHPNPTQAAGKLKGLRRGFYCAFYVGCTRTPFHTFRFFRSKDFFFFIWWLFYAAITLLSSQTFSTFAFVSPHPSIYFRNDPFFTNFLQSLSDSRGAQAGEGAFGWKRLKVWFPNGKVAIRWCGF